MAVRPKKLLSLCTVADRVVRYLDAKSCVCQALFEKHGVVHELHTIDEGEHGFGGASDPRQIDAAYEAIEAFLAQQWGLTLPPTVTYDDASQGSSRM